MFSKCRAICVASLTQFYTRLFSRVLCWDSFKAEQKATKSALERIVFSEFALLQCCVVQVKVNVSGGL